MAQHAFRVLQERWPLAPLVITPAFFAGVIYVTNTWYSGAKSSGIPQVIAAAKNPQTVDSRSLLSLPTALVKMIMTLAMMIVGGSVGREGPAVQVSAAIMVAFHRLLRVPITSGVVIAGGAAGVAAAFNTPLAGVAFAIEELAAGFEQRVAVLVMGTVVVAGLVSLGIAGDYVYFGAMRSTLPIESVVVVAPVAGIVGGLVGGLFSRMLLAMTKPRYAWQTAIKSRPVLMAATCGLVVATTGIIAGGSTWGTGYEATRALIEGETTSLWFGPAKFLATLATALSGAPGGIFAPSLSVGAGFGQLLAVAFPDDPTGAVVLLGMMGYFVGVVRAPLTAVVILMETTASRGMILPLFATALVADGVSALVCRDKLYHGLATALMPEPEQPPKS
ncbi:chloride channel protein [Pelagerythrobacter aerophilus]|uniref:Chloride channel protein n=2 Tax=Pelagerythrobacter aerophilus TaxID=2306995 RepID=A0A418NGL6_9SPHN|nr:chloride channel protein [Pelagerythrobacter aerophilus]